ncbi:MAG TPA: hypothetical protein VGF49_06100, partial [Candidatus Solibacter sp.]
MAHHLDFSETQVVGAGKLHAHVAALHSAGGNGRGGDWASRSDDCSRCRPREALERLGGSLEIRSGVALPMGSGLGTSSILAATMLRGIQEITGAE